MKRRLVLAAAMALILILAVAAPLTCQAPTPTPDPDRYLDTAPARDGNVRLVIFNPDVFNLQCLVALRKNGAIDIPNLTVIGVYHVKQSGRFAPSHKYVEENGLDWVKFHAVSAETSEPVLFKTNACTPEYQQILQKADGVVFFGGPDIPPSIYGEKTLLLNDSPDAYRNFLEVSAAFHFLGGSQDPKFKPLLEARPGFPILAICLGCQSLNVGTGGTLIQDIWTEIYGQTTVEDVIALGPEQWHNNPYKHLFPSNDILVVNYHTLQLGDNSKFVKVMGFKSSDHPRIRSSHHQALEKIGQDLVAVASSRDGRIIEAVEHKRYPNVLGVQFHPEHYLHFDAEPRFHMKPGDPLTSLRAILEGAPPSFEFNKAIWLWFSTRLVESHGK